MKNNIFDTELKFYKHPINVRGSFFNFGSFDSYDLTNDCTPPDSIARFITRGIQHLSPKISIELVIKNREYFNFKINGFEYDKWYQILPELQEYDDIIRHIYYLKDKISFIHEK